MERYLEYWQACLQQQHLHALKPQDVAPLCAHITREECVSGKLIQSDMLQTHGAGLVAVIPTYARNQEQYFFPCMLIAELNAQNELCASAAFNLPIIPHTVLEPAALCPISMGQAEQFNDYIAINPPTWLDDATQLTWQNLRVYCEQLINEVNTQWRHDLTQKQFVLQDDVLIVPLRSLLPQLQDLSNVKLDILMKSNKITLIDAARNSGQSTHAQQLILKAWVQAALKQTAPPRYVWLRANEPINYASIFACVNADAKPSDTDNAHAALLAAHDLYLRGEQVLRNWQDMDQRIADKYFDKGGIEQRTAQLQASLKAAKAQYRHLQVLHSIWIRQQELLTKWSKMFDFVTLMQSQRLARLYNFFKQNFPDDKVAGLSHAALDDLMIEKVRRAENNERMVADALHQVENDQHQANIVRDTCLQWCALQHMETTDAAAIQEHLRKLWADICGLAARYWHQTFAQQPGYAQFLHQTPDHIELLIVEHAEYIDPISAARLLSISKRAVVMGSYNAICNPRFAVHIDYQLTKHFGLVENDADFEDLQFDGILGSVGNMWHMVAKDRDADEIFTAKDSELAYELINVDTPSSYYHGSKVNQGVISVLVDWLHKHTELHDQLAIYTCFSGQAQLIHNALHNTAFAQIPVHMLQEINLCQSACSIFLPVYTTADPGPYVFDRGTDMFDQLQANTQQKLLVIGDSRLFNAKLHSASGKFAKHLTMPQLDFA